MSSIQQRKQLDKANPNPPLNSNNEEEAPVKLTPKDQFKYGDVKVTSPGVGRVSITIH
jgi:hypothetical protein